MKLSKMIERIRRKIPSLTVESVSDEVITDELNNGCDEANAIAQVYKGYTDITSVIGQQIYRLHIVATRYAGMSTNGVWWVDSNGKYKRLFPKTIKWLDLNIENWRDQVAGEPQWYWVEGNDFGLYPKPSTANTVRIYHLLTAVPMDNPDNYPWENLSTEVTALKPFDDAIIAYAAAKLSPAVGKDNAAASSDEDFLKEVRKASQQVKRRKDVTSDRDYFIRIDGQPT